MIELFTNKPIFRGKTEGAQLLYQMQILGTIPPDMLNKIGESYKYPFDLNCLSQLRKISPIDLKKYITDNYFYNNISGIFT